MSVNWVQLGEDARMLRDHLNDVYLYSFDQFGDSANETKLADALLHSFAKVRQYLQKVARKEYGLGSVRLFYGSRTLVGWKIHITLVDRPKVYTEKQLMHLYQVCHQMSVFMETAKKILGTEKKARRLVRRTNKQIASLLKMIRPNQVKRELFP